MLIDEVKISRGYQSFELFPGRLRPGNNSDIALTSDS